jgi:peptidoglycan/LPS O-acetylase OafA/YrhL
MQEAKGALPSAGGMPHISDIDGLRAVAVASVVMFHAGFAAFSGGYVGVDVFFVISGFLITGLIQRAMGAGGFSLANFYARRVLRIAPALFVTTLGVCTVFLALSPPVQHATLLQTVFAGLLSYSNLWFYFKVDYFQAGTDLPLLHTWSLAVEEQFYLVLPWVLMALATARNTVRRAVLAALAVASLVAAQWVLRTDPQGAFYLPWLRAWELLAGSLLSTIDASRVPPAWRRWAGALGLCAIAVSVFTYREAMAFPGVAAMLPVAGALGVILSAGERSLVARLLTAPPLTWLGKISYSVYLVHWPIVCLVGMLLSFNAGPSKYIVLVSSLVLGWASWRFVETPFRAMAGRVPQQRVLWRFAGAVAGVGALAVGVSVVSGMWWASHPQAMRYANGFNASREFMMQRGCLLTPKTFGAKAGLANECLALDAAKRNVLLVGDSHAGNLAEALRVAYGSQAHLVQATATGCRPYQVPAGPANNYCEALNNRMLGEWVPAHGQQVDTVVLVARWEFADMAPLAATVAELRQHVKHVVVLGPWPEYYMPAPLLAAYQSIWGVDLPSLLSRKDRFALDASLRQQLGPNYRSAIEPLCQPRCPVVRSGELLYLDRDHFTAYGAKYVVDALGVF